LTLRGQIKTVISELKTMMDAFSVQLAKLNTQVGDLQASIVEKDQQIAELSQRPTVEELQDARTESLVLSADQEANLVTLEFDDPGKRQPPGLGQSARESDYHSPSGRG
jgi:phage shock protein A